MVGSAITLNGQYKTPRILRVFNCNVDKIPCSTYLVLNLIVTLTQRLNHLQFKWRISSLTSFPSDFKLTRLGIFEEVFQCPNAKTGSRIELKLVSPEVTKHTHRQFGTSDQNIESAMPTLAVQRAKLLGYPPGLITPITDTDKDLVSFITLDVLQVLYEERLTALRREKRLSFRHLPPQQFDLNLNQITLRHTECRDPQ